MKTKTFQGVTFSIDRPKGTVKEWPRSDGGVKRFTYPCDYGYLRQHTGEDGEALDFFVGDDPHGHIESFQKLRDGVLDETKFLVGVTDEERETIYKLYGNEVWHRRVYRTLPEALRYAAKFKGKLRKTAMHIPQRYDVLIPKTAYARAGLMGAGTGAVLGGAGALLHNVTRGEGEGKANVMEWAGKGAVGGLAVGAGLHDMRQRRIQRLQGGAPTATGNPSLSDSTNATLLNQERNRVLSMYGSDSGAKTGMLSQRYDVLTVGPLEKDALLGDLWQKARSYLTTSRPSMMPLQNTRPHIPSGPVMMPLQNTRPHAPRGPTGTLASQHSGGATPVPHAGATAPSSSPRAAPLGGATLPVAGMADKTPSWNKGSWQPAPTLTGPYPVHPDAHPGQHGLESWLHDYQMDPRTLGPEGRTITDGVKAQHQMMPQNPQAQSAVLAQRGVGDVDRSIMAEVLRQFEHAHANDPARARQLYHSLGQAEAPGYGAAKGVIEQLYGKIASVTRAVLQTYGVKLASEKFADIEKRISGEVLMSILNKRNP